MKRSGFQRVRGVHDGLPLEVRRWRMIEETAREVFGRYGFEEVRLPVLEPTGLFVRSIGEETDIVAKEMYRFVDQGGADLCLRPEGTAGAVRAYIQAGLAGSKVQRWYYMGPMFRRERPQKGRLRQFQQIGVELFGASGPVEDAEVLAMARDLLVSLEITNVRFEINSLGCPKCRPNYRSTLMAFLASHAEALCATCRQRSERNPMRVLDCKNEGCRKVLADAPVMMGYLCEECAAHFAGLENALAALQVEVDVNPRIVRGLDYYTRTAFEISSPDLGAQSAVIAGGRYDGLVAELGGPDVPAIGFALGLERLAMIVPEPKPVPPPVALVALGDEVQGYALEIAREMRAAGVPLVHCGSGSAKALFKRAHREGASLTLVVGEEEMREGLVSLKRMDQGTQQRLPLAEAITLCQRECNKGA